MTTSIQLGKVHRLFTTYTQSLGILSQTLTAHVVIQSVTCISKVVLNLRDLNFRYRNMQWHTINRIVYEIGLHISQYKASCESTYPCRLENVEKRPMKVDIATDFGFHFEEKRYK